MPRCHARRRVQCSGVMLAGAFDVEVLCLNVMLAEGFNAQMLCPRKSAR